MNRPLRPGEPPWLETERLRLRSVTHADVDALWRLWTDPQVRRYLWDDEVIARATAAEQCELSLAAFARSRLGLWLLLGRADDALLGFGGLRACADVPEVELLYGLYPWAWGRGLATEAARAFLRYGFEELALERILARTDAPNRASVAVMERLGMQFERRGLVAGLDTIEYGLARRTWQERAGRAEDRPPARGFPAR